MLPGFKNALFYLPYKCKLIKCDKGSFSLHRQDLRKLAAIPARLPIAQTDITPLVISI